MDKQSDRHRKKHLIDPIESDEDSNNEQELNENEEKDKTEESAGFRQCVATDTYEQEKKFHTPGQKRKHTENPEPSTSQINPPPLIDFPKMQKCSIDDKMEFVTGKFENIEEFIKELKKLDELCTLKLYNCSIKTLNNEVIPLTNTIKCIVFNNCNDNVFKAFRNLTSLEKIDVHNDEWTWNGFPHDTFNEICGNCKDLHHIMLNGAGTGSYFNCDQFPYKIKKLETTMITFHWYVGIKTRRIKFLESQKESLKELTIHELPYDFDGGKVLKYIFEEMNLDTFYYGNIPLILNGQRQEVKEFEASEIQFTSALEMFRQFPSIEKFLLKISNIDISSEDIKSALNFHNDVFSNIKEFIVNDNSRGTLGVFLGNLKNLNNLQKLTIITKNKYINTILKCLPIMPNLKEIQLSSYEKRCTNDVSSSFGDGVNVVILNDPNAPGGSNGQRSNDDDDEMSNREGGGNDDDDGKKDDEGGDESATSTVPPSYPIIALKDRKFPIRSSFPDHNINDSRKLYVHICGHAKNIVTEKNCDELDELIAEEEFARHLYLFIEEGKIVFEFRDNQDDYPKQLKAKIEQLAYQPNEKVQLPLITSLNNPKVTVKCCAPINMKWDSFLTAVNSCNKGLDSAKWKPSDPFPQGFFVFQMDAVSYYQIVKRGSQLNIHGKECVIEIVDVNPYANDVKALQELNILE